MKMPAGTLIMTTGHFSFGSTKITPLLSDRHKKPEAFQHLHFPLESYTIFIKLVYTN